MLFNHGQSIPAVLWHALLGLAAVALFGSGCDTSELVTLQGASATFPEPLCKRWFRESYDIDLNVRASYHGIDHHFSCHPPFPSPPAP